MNAYFRCVCYALHVHTRTFTVHCIVLFSSISSFLYFHCAIQYLFPTFFFVCIRRHNFTIVLIKYSHSPLYASLRMRFGHCLYVHVYVGFLLCSCHVAAYSLFWCHCQRHVSRSHLLTHPHLLNRKTYWHYLFIWTLYRKYFILYICIWSHKVYKFVKTTVEEMWTTYFL